LRFTARFGVAGGAGDLPLDRMSFHAAGDLLEAALRVDPTHTDALAWYAYWHLFLVGQGWAGDPEAATSRAAELADRAVATDPNDARALTWQAMCAAS